MPCDDIHPDEQVWEADREEQYDTAHVQLRRALRRLREAFPDLEPCPMLAHASQHHTRPDVHAVAEPSQSGRGWCTQLSWVSVSVRWRAGSSFAGVGSGLSVGRSSDGDAVAFSNPKCEYSPVVVLIHMLCAHTDPAPCFVTPGQYLVRFPSYFDDFTDHQPPP